MFNFYNINKDNVFLICKHNNSRMYYNDNYENKFIRKRLLDMSVMFSK